MVSWPPHIAGINVIALSSMLYLSYCMLQSGNKAVSVLHNKKGETTREKASSFVLSAGDSSPLCLPR